MSGSDDHLDEHHQTKHAPDGVIQSLFTFRGADQRVRPTEPLVVFTDAILAIAATLLVFQLQLPEELKPHTLWHEIARQWPTWVAILFGYLWLVASWLNLRRLRRMLRGVDHYATLLYLLLIMTITLIPFLMLVLARSLGEPDFPVAVQLLAALSLLDGILASVLLRYASRRGLGVPSMTPQAWREVLLPNYILTSLDLVSIFVAPLIPWIVLAFIAADWLYALLPLFTDRAGIEETVAIEQ